MVEQILWFACMFFLLGCFAVQAVLAVTAWCLRESVVIPVVAFVVTGTMLVLCATWYPA